MTGGCLGLRREAERHAALGKALDYADAFPSPKAPSPLRFAGAVQNALRTSKRKTLELRSFTTCGQPLLARAAVPQIDWLHVTC